MALTFGAVNTDVVNHGNLGAGSGATQFSVGMWFNCTTFTANRGLAEKHNTGATQVAWVLRLTGTTEVQLLWVGSTNINYVTTDLAISTGVDMFLGLTIDSGAGAGNKVKVFTRTRTTTMRACSMSSFGEGSGLEDPGGAFTVGNRTAAPTTAFQGRISNCWVLVGKALTSDEWQLLSSKPWKYWTEMVLWSEYGLPGTGTQPDYSGNGNTGTVTGATASEHVALNHPFWIPNHVQMAAQAARKFILTTPAA